MKFTDLTLEEKVGQMIGLAFSGTEYSPELKMQVEEMGVGLVIYFKDNCGSPKQIYELNQQIVAKSKIPPFIALDQEGGMVARVTEGIVQSPGAMAISATNIPKYCYQLAYNMGLELREIGFNFNFAPVGDINNNPLNPVINVRSYSEDPDVVCTYVKEAVKGYHDAGLMTSIKHFPGHGDTAVDSHIGLPKVSFDKERLYKMELIPFVLAKEENLPGIMASHVMFTTFDDVYPTTLSKKIITGLLREEIGYDGLVVTDSLTMKAVYDNFTISEIVRYTFNSGCDIMLLCGARDIKMQREFFDEAVRMAKSGEISLELIDNAVKRILRYKEMYRVGSMPNVPFGQLKLNNHEAIELTKRVSLESITMIRNHGNARLSNEDKTLVVFPKIKVVTLVENDEFGLQSLADFLETPCDKVYIPLNPSIEDQEKVRQISGKYDKIVFCSYNACFNPNQAQLINTLDPKKTIVVAIRTPYDYNVIKDEYTYLCAYEATPLSFEAVAKVLSGRFEAKGIIPVTLK